MLGLEEGGLIRRTMTLDDAMPFATQIEARTWWDTWAMSLPPLPPLGQGETIRLIILEAEREAMALWEDYGGASTWEGLPEWSEGSPMLVRSRDIFRTMAAGVLARRAPLEALAIGARNYRKAWIKAQEILGIGDDDDLIQAIQALQHHARESGKALNGPESGAPHLPENR